MAIIRLMYTAIEMELEYNRDHFSLKTWKPWQLRQLRRYVQ